MINEKIRIKSLPRSILRADVADLLIEICQSCMAEPMDVFLIIGQSNAKGMSGPGGAALSPNPSEDTVYQYYQAALSQVVNEVANANTGSIWPSMGITWYNMTRRRICFVQRAVNSTALSNAINDFGAGNWSQTGTHYPNSVTALNDAMAAVMEAGFKPVFRGVICSLGETDAIGINNSQTTKAEYVANMLELIDAYRQVFGTTMPFFILKTGQRVGDNDAGYAEVRDGQEEVVAANPVLNKFIYRSTYDFVARGMMQDVVHYNQAANNEIGVEAPAVILGGKNPV